MIDTKQKVERIDRRISLNATNRLSDQLLSDDILTLIVDHQHILFRNKLSTLKRIYSLESTEEKNGKILNDWIYIASSYCYILFENDLDCCDDLAIEIFTAYYLISKLVFMKIKNLSVEFNKMNLKDRTNMNILLNKFDDLMSTHRHEYFQKICEKVDLLIPPSDNVTITTHQTEKSLDLDTSNKYINSPAEFYPQSKQEEEEEEDDDYDDDLLSTTSSAYSSSESSVHETKSSFPTSIMRSISAESLFSMDSQNVVLLNIQNRNIHSSSRRILTIDPKSIVDPQYFNSSILPYLNVNDTVIFFSRSETISGIERYLYNVLTLNNFKNVFWLKGGYHAFKSEFLKNKTSKREIANPQHSSNRSPPPPIPESQPIITTTPTMNDISNKILPSQPSINSNNQILSKQLFPATPNNNIDTTTPSSKNPNQRYSHSYSSLTDAKSSISNESLPQNHLYTANDNSFRKLTYLNKSVQNTSNENLYNSIQNKSQTLNLPIQPKSLLPSSLPPMPPIPTTKPIVPSTDVPPIPNISLSHEYSPTPPKLYKLSRLDYKPTISLRNLGSTCYINSLIQCLFSLNKFRHFFINDEKLKSYLHNLNSRNLKLTSGFHDLFSTFYDKSPHNALPPIIDITKFLSIIARLNPSYNIPNEQQDTSQFFYYIIDELHKELKFNYSTTMKLNLVSLSNDKGEKFHDWQLKLLQNEGYSFIQNLFNIKEAVVMKCNRCGYISTRYDTSIMIHLSLKSTSCTLNEILMQNYKSEEMSTRLGNAWDCDGCTRAEKELEELQEKIEKEYDMNMANKEKLKEKEHDKDNLKEKDKSKKNKDKDKQKDSLLSKTFFRRHNNKTKNREGKDSKDSDVEKYEVTPEPNDFISNVLSEHERKEYNRLADIFTKERVAYRSVEFIELPDVLVLCLSLFNPNQQDAKVIMKDLKFPETLNMQFEKCSRAYKLNSWIDHLGSSIDSGHYTATVPFQHSSYIVCDDDKLIPAQNISNNTVSDNDVYLLFYEAI